MLSLLSPSHKHTNRHFHSLEPTEIALRKVCVKKKMGQLSFHRLCFMLRQDSSHSRYGPSPR